jgi:hypothetical protein
MELSLLSPHMLSWREQRRCLLVNQTKRGYGPAGNPTFLNSGRSARLPSPVLSLNTGSGV